MPTTAVAGAAAAAAAGGTARSAFAYNRENYMFDQGLRFGRFNTGYSMAQAQASQYREDITDLTGLTVTKADAYHTVGTICFVLNFQLIMAGRLGVHGPSPPGWLLGLYWTNICSALMFLVTFTWMAMHAGARATAGAAYMRTRSVRLPIPTPSMLDDARKTGNAFEKERLADMFRIPFVMPAGKESVVDEEQGVTVPVSDRRMPKWYRDEVKELRKDEGGAAPSPTSVPEHFELYRGLQEEWWAYDVYSRIGVMFFFSHWLTSASLYSMCHILTELRCLWPVWTVTPCFVAAHYGILQLDIVSKPREGSLMCLPLERIVPFVPFLAALGMSIDYSVLEPTPIRQGFIYFVSCIAYLIQFAWALRLYDLAAPQYRLKESPEYAGEAWTPKEWPVPPAFAQAVYLVSAPKYLEAGQTCLQQEMKAAKGPKGEAVSPNKGRSVAPAMLPWKLFRGAIITSISMWVLIMCGRVFEMVNGERFLLKQEGRVERWPSHMQPWMAPWTRKGTRNEMCHTGGCDRRLSGLSEVASAAQRLAAALTPLADALETSMEPSAKKILSQMEQARGVQWPGALRPAVLAARGGRVAALERRGGRGALLEEAAFAVAEALALQLEGVEELGEIHSATWGESGLLLVGSGFALAECSGLPSGTGSWSCQLIKGQGLPAGLRAATAGRRAGGTLRAAVAFEGEDSTVLLEQAADGTWLPAGEVQLPVASGTAFELALANDAEELVVASADGAVIRRAISGGAGRKVVPPQRGPLAAWHGACGLARGRVARLAADAGAPMLFVDRA